MWGKKDEQLPSSVSTPGSSSESAVPVPPSGLGKTSPASTTGIGLERGRSTAQIGKSLSLKGEISGGEDVYVDGEIEGTVALEENALTVGPNGRVHANVTARAITILGLVQGNVRASERIEIRKTGSLEGDLVTARIVIEDGAVFRGSIDIIKTSGAKAVPHAAKTPVPAAELTPRIRSIGTVPDGSG